MASGVAPGNIAVSSATAPVTCGAANEVPDTTVVPAGPVDRDPLAVGRDRREDGAACTTRGRGPRTTRRRRRSTRCRPRPRPGAEAGLAPVPAPGPELPAANTGTMPAARRAARSPSNSVSQRPGPPSSHEPLTTLGASSVRGLPSGSSAHSKARCTALVVLRPPSLNTRAAMMRTSGAIETTTSATSVPCPAASSSNGVECSSYGSNQLPLAVESCGKPGAMPVSSTATTAPRPVWPCAHICRRARGGHARARHGCGRRERGRHEAQRAVRADRAHVRSPPQPCDQPGLGAQRDRVVDPQRRARRVASPRATAARRKRMSPA